MRSNNIDRQDGMITVHEVKELASKPKVRKATTKDGNINEIARRIILPQAMETNQKLEKTQYGFRKGHTTVQEGGRVVERNF